MEPYKGLPGISIGAHDSIEILGEGDDVDPHWWHHGDYDPRNPVGTPCVRSIRTHKFYNYKTYTAWIPPEKIEEQVQSGDFSVTPSILCKSCGRHIFIRAGRASTFGNAHNKWDQEQEAKKKEAARG